MRQKRAKTYKRVMALYTGAFGFRQPFQILASQDILLEGGKSDLNMVKQFLQVTQGECKPMITQCCMEALYKLGKDVQYTTDLAKTFERRKCNHRTSLEPDECLKDVIGQTNKHRYVLASQSSALRTALQNIPGLPIIHFNPRGVLVLSPPSTATVREKNKLEEARRIEGVQEMVGVVDGENVVGGGAGPSAAVPATRTRKVKGPNPLSIRKKKSVTETVGQGGEAGVGKKRGRDRDWDGDEGGPSDGGDRPELGERAEGEEGDDASGKRKRKRKKKKSAVGEAIAELNAQQTGASAYSVAEGSDDE